MDKLKFYFIVCVSSLLLFSCGEDDVDNVTMADYTFVITNGTSAKLDIVYEHLSKSENGPNTETFTLYPSDSIARLGETHGIAGKFVPFMSARLFLVFDDTLTYLCEPNTELRCMVDRPECYKREEKAPDVYVCRYVITEEDYEYAKAHPYMGE